MTHAPARVLFLSVRNSGRSILAEALANERGHGRLQAISAGTDVAPAVSPVALEVLRRMRTPTAGLRPKRWSEVCGPGSPKFDIVVTIRSRTKYEELPVWPGQRIAACWALDDPGDVRGSFEQQLNAFWAAATALTHYIDDLLLLPEEHVVERSR
jgi:protein-tyrosine-phosphatase